MERVDIEKSIKTALDEFFEHEQYLIDVDANERSISHKIAEYIQPMFSDWNVDCEYNRNMEHPKILGIPIEDTKTDDTDGKTVYPDIIIHKRGKKKTF